MAGISMQVALAAAFVLLQMTSAYSVIGKSNEHHNHTLVRRSAEHACNQAIVDNLAKTAKETCSQVDAVDKYIANVKSTKQVQVPSSTDRHGFKAILSQYNGDLKTAQEHCQPWRNGENVLASLKKVVLAAQRFEPKFSQELVKNKDRVKNLLENHEDIREVEAKIAALQKDIDEAKETVKLTNSTAVLDHLKSVIKSKEEEINATMKEHKFTQGKRELAELVKYLDFVKTGAVETENEAQNANTKLGKFRENIMRDAGAFKRHRSNAQKGITKLQEEKKNNNNELQSNRNTVTTLRAKIAEENRQIASLNAQIQRTHQEVREIEARINRNMRRTKKKRRFGRWFRFVPVVGWTIGNKFYKDAKRREQQLANEKRNIINERTRQVQNLQNHIANRNRDIANHQGRIRTLETKSRELEQELQHFSQLDGNLQSLETQLNAILPSIANAVNGVSKMRETFDSIKQNLGSAIEKAKEAKTEAEVKNMRYFVYNEIDDLQCKWENAQTKIVPIGNCA